MEVMTRYYVFVTSTSGFEVRIFLQKDAILSFSLPTVPMCNHDSSPLSETITVCFCTQAGVLGFQFLHELQHAAGQNRPPLLQRRTHARQRLGAGAALRPQMGVSSNTVREIAPEVCIRLRCLHGCQSANVEPGLVLYAAK